MSGIPRELTLALSLVPIAQVDMAAVQRARPYLAAVAGRRELTTIRWDGRIWHDGELVVTPIAVFFDALPPSADVLA
jgi:hypothetical protein